MQMGGMGGWKKTSNQYLELEALLNAVINLYRYVEQRNRKWAVG